MMKIDAKGKTYKVLNEEIRAALRNGEENLVLENVNGHRYIGDNIDFKAKIEIHGVPGNDLAFAMDGPILEVFANGQDAIGNTMNAGKIIIHGNAGDICGYAMRGGKLFIEGNVGYRAGIHMKEYMEKYPTIVVGGKAGDFFGEYMAGGLLVVLGIDNKDMDKEKPIVGNFCGTGMHGGRMFINGTIEEWRLGKEVKVKELDEDDIKLLDEVLAEYSKDLGIDVKSKIDYKNFIKLYPGSKRPYGRLYAY